MLQTVCDEKEYGSSCKYETKTEIRHKPPETAHQRETRQREERLGFPKRADDTFLAYQTNRFSGGTCQSIWGDSLNDIITSGKFSPFCKCKGAKEEKIWVPGY